MRALPTTVSASAATRRGDSQRTRRVHLRARELARLRCQNLELDILNLRQEIAMLANLRRLLYARTLNRPDDLSGCGIGRFEKIVREFYTLSADGGYSETVWRMTEAIDFEQFMRASFDPALAIGDDSAPTDGGLDGFLVLLGQMTVVLDSPQAKLLQAHVTQRETLGLAKVYVKSGCTCSLTGMLLDKVFPHLRDAAPWLRDKLIGRTLVTMSEGQFTFDTESGRVVRVTLSADYAPGILDLAASLDELAILKGEAQIVELPQHEDDEEKEIQRPNEGSDLSPMSLEYVLSCENDDDNNAEEEKEMWRCKDN